jgi:hypothetical protein
VAEDDLRKSHCTSATLDIGTGDREAKVRAPKNKENAPAGESANQSKRRKGKLIRLDDLIPKQDVTGGVRLLFGASETTEIKK